MWDYSLLIEQDLSAKKQLVFCEFVVLAENGATIVTKNKFVSIVLNCKIFSFFRHNTDSLLISFQSSRINGELRAFSNLLLRTSKPTGALQTCCEDITNNQGDLLQKR